MNYLKIILGFFIVSISVLQAQITIDQNDMPNSGDVYFVANASNFGLDYASTGQGITWDFSMLDTTIIRQDTFRSVLSTNVVYIAMFNNIFDQTHLASYALQVDNSNFTNPAVQINNVYNFIQNNSSHYSVVGFGADVNGIPTAAKYNDPEKYYDFPLNYNDTDSSVSVWSINVPNFGYFGQTIHHHFEVDGWGTLVTPVDTFSVLRIKNTIDTHDTVHIDSLGFGTGFNQPAQIEYVWLANGQGIPVLKATERNGNITGVEYKIYNLPTSVTISDLDKKVNVFFSDGFLHFTNNSKETENVQLISMTGKIVLSNEIHDAYKDISCQGVHEGVYIVKVTDEAGNYLIKKILIN